MSGARGVCGQEGAALPVLLKPKRFGAVWPSLFLKAVGTLRLGDVSSPAEISVRFVRSSLAEPDS